MTNPTTATVVYSDTRPSDEDADRIASAYGCDEIRDLPANGKFEPGVLYLTDSPDSWDKGQPQSCSVRCVSIEIAMEMVSINEGDRA